MILLTSTSYLPPVAYLAAVVRAGAVVIEAYETYQKQTCRNHCVIPGPNGPLTLTIPVIKTNGNHTVTRDIKISDQLRWQIIHWRSIETAYNNAPFFLYYKDYFEPLYRKPFQSLIDLNSELLVAMFQCLHIKREITLTRQYDKNPQGVEDLRSVLVAKHNKSIDELPFYTQVFGDRHGFRPDMSAIDLIFNLGPEAPEYLLRLNTLKTDTASD